MKKTKPSTLQNGYVKKEKLQKRQAEEIRLKGNGAISKAPPSDLCTRGKEVYEELVESLPSDFLSNLDTNTVVTVADAVANMEKCREILNTEGVLVLTPQGMKQNQALMAYAKYNEIFRKNANDLGLSPTSRSKLANMKVQQIAEEKDPLLQVLKGHKSNQN